MQYRRGCLKGTEVKDDHRSNSYDVQHRTDWFGRQHALDHAAGEQRQQDVDEGRAPVETRV